MSTKFRERLGAMGLLLFRVLFGAMMLFGHGWPKAMRFGELSESFPDPLGVGTAASLALAVFGEAICSALIIVGLGTRLAALALLVTMGVAAFVIHGGDPFSDRELALLYAAFALGLLATGPGPISLDTLLLRRWRARRARGE